MKEIGKLLELLNEKEKELSPSIQVEWTEFSVGINKWYLISKECGFIKWLVENDKIDREKFGNSETKSSKYSDYELSYDTPREDYINILLMELAIQDEPIQFLIGILRWETYSP